MSTAVNTSSLGTSSIRGTSKQTRINPARSSRNARSIFRQNSLISNPTSMHGAPVPESHGFYPAITHFSDAIAALPRDFRRHTSLLKEVDAKAWSLEDDLQKLLQECLHERQTKSFTSTTQNLLTSNSSLAGDVSFVSAANSVNSILLDNASQYSNASADPDLSQRRHLYAALRNKLKQMMMPLDEKNHVISNANEELSRHTRRQDEIWPYIVDEISEETRLGSLRHWALTDLNPTKKVQAAVTRAREAASGLSALHDNDIAERSERRREALLAKKQKTAQQQVASDADERVISRKGASAGKKKVATINNEYIETVDLLPPGHTRLPYKGKSVAPKDGKPAGLKGINQIGAGGVSMSRENSQQENAKKRKAPTAPIPMARKRINAATQESPKLGHSPLANVGKEPYKKSPALATSKLANGRGRQSSGQLAEGSNRPSSSASRRNGMTANASELDRVAVATGKTTTEVKQTMKETVNSKGETLFEEDVPDTVENRIRGGILLERSNSRSSYLKKEMNHSDETIGRRTASPRLAAANMVEGNMNERNGRGRASKTSTPVVGSFAEAESESTAEPTSTAENGNDSNAKLKRPVRPRMKDHHGLHDSLSPKGLPTKRTHKKNGSYSISAALSTSRTKDKEDEIPTIERKNVSSRTNSRSAKNNSISEVGRNASSTPKLGYPSPVLFDEPEPFFATAPADEAKTNHASSRRQSSKHAHGHSSTSHFDVKPPTSNPRNMSAVTSQPVSRPTTAQTDGVFDRQESLGSPGPEEADMEPESNADADAEEEEEEDPDEQRYCYCNGVSYGEMVACDNKKCAREWFHLECTGLRSLPPARSTWYCDECKGVMAK